MGSGALVKYFYRGKLDGKAGSVAGVGEDVDGSFVEGDDALGKGEAQAKAAGVACP